MNAITKAYKSGNTVRITLGRHVRRELYVLAGDYIRLDDIVRGRCVLTVLDTQGKPKCQTKSPRLRSRKSRSR